MNQTEEERIIAYLREEVWRAADAFVHHADDGLERMYRLGRFHGAVLALTFLGHDEQLVLQSENP